MVDKSTNKFIAKLYLEHRKGLLLYALNKLTLHGCSDNTYSEDIVQEVFIQAFHAFALLCDHEAPCVWLYETCDDIVKHFANAVNKECIVISQVSASIDPIGRWHRRTIISELFDLACKSISPFERKIISAWMNGDNISEIAKQYHVSDAMIYRMQRRIKRVLKNIAARMFSNEC